MTNSIIFLVIGSILGSAIYWLGYFMGKRSVRQIDMKSRPDTKYYPIMCEYDEAFTINEMLEETNRCCNCKITECPYCGKSAEDKEVN